MRRILSIAAGLGLGMSLSQFPEFSQQYAQRLGGAIDELTVITENFDTAAQRDGLSREQAFARYDASADDFIVEQGQQARAVFVRHDKLLAHQTALENAGTLEKVTSFVEHFDSKLASRTWEAYQPAVPVTFEGLTLAGIGFVGGYGLISLLGLPFRRRRKTQTV